jgi:hypothetical protein
MAFQGQVGRFKDMLDEHMYSFKDLLCNIFRS